MDRKYQFDRYVRLFEQETTLIRSVEHLVQL